MDLAPSRRKFLKTAIHTTMGVGSYVIASDFWQSYAHANEPKRIVIADGAISETALAMGIVPLAMADIPGYRAWVRQPEVPDQVINLGARFQPNLERVAQLKPDIILTSSFYANQYSELRKLARIETIDIYSGTKTPFANAIKAAEKIAAITGHKAAAQDLIQQTSARIENSARTLHSSKAKSILITSMLSPRHLRVFGQNSLLQDVIDQLPVQNAWTGPTNHWGFTTVSIDQIASFSDAAMIAIEPVPANVKRAVDHSPILGQLPAIKNFGLIQMPPVATFGGLYAAGRFSELVASALTDPSGQASETPS